MIVEIAGGKISSPVQAQIAKPVVAATIELSHAYLNGLVGNEISAAEIEKILTALEFEITAKTNDGWQLKVPTYRVDVTRPADVVEEFLRIYGFNRVELPTHMRLSISAEKVQDDESFKKMTSALLTAHGYFEAMNNSLTKATYYEKMLPDAVPTLVHMLNPLSQDLAVMRQTLFFGGLEVMNRNINRQRSDVKIFEFGKVYGKKDNGKYEEHEQLMVMLTGAALPESWAYKAEKSTFFHLSGLVNQLLRRLGVSIQRTQATAHAIFGEGIELHSANQVVAELYQLPAKTTAHFDVSQDVFAAIIHWEKAVQIAHRHKTKFEDLPRYPWVRRDLALLIDQAVAYEDMRVAASKAGGKLLKSVNLFDVYTGKNLPEGKKSYAMSFVLQDPTETLTDVRVEQVMEKIQSSLAQQFGAQLR
jgi:phenylalanyl-tRNA synthetase beta chain